MLYWIIGFIVFVGLIGFAFSWASKWSALAEAYPNPGEFNGKRHAFQSATVNYVPYFGAFVFGLNGGGFYMEPNTLISFFHPKVFIPLGDIKIRIEKDDGVEKKSIKCEKCPDILIVVSEEWIQKIHERVKAKKNPPQTSSDSQAPESSGNLQRDDMDEGTVEDL